jgi:hypothetical protein
MWLPLTTFGLICVGMIAFGFYDKARYLAAHPEENSDAPKKKV